MMQLRRLTTDDELRTYQARFRETIQAKSKGAMRGEVPRTFVAVAYSAVRDRENALRWLNRALDEREPVLRDNIRSPALKELRGDPRYEALLRRLERGFED